MRAHDPEGNLVQQNPAEVATPVAMAAAVLICKLVGVDDVDTIGYVAILVAFVPTAIKFLVSLKPPPRRRRRQAKGGP